MCFTYPPAIKATEKALFSLKFGLKISDRYSFSIRTSDSGNMGSNRSSKSFSNLYIFLTCPPYKKPALSSSFFLT